MANYLPSFSSWSTSGAISNRVVTSDGTGIDFDMGSESSYIYAEFSTDANLVGKTLQIDSSEFSCSTSQSSGTGLWVRIRLYESNLSDYTYYSFSTSGKISSSDIDLGLLNFPLLIDIPITCPKVRIYIRSEYDGGVSETNLKHVTIRNFSATVYEESIGPVEPSDFVDLHKVMASHLPTSAPDDNNIHLYYTMNSSGYVNQYISTKNGLIKPVNKGVSIIPNQGLTDTEKANARQNIDTISIRGGEFKGTVQAYNSSTHYADGQIRNIFLSDSEPTASDGENGDIWIIY